MTDLQAAMRALWPDRPKVYFRSGQGDDAPVLTDAERGQLSRVAQAIGSARESGYRQHAAEAEDDQRERSEKES